MPKKKPARRHTKRSSSRFAVPVVHKQVWFIYLSAVALFLVGAVGWLFVSGQQLPCANSISCIKDLSGKYDLHAKEGEFMGSKVSAPIFVAEGSLASNTQVLGDSSNKHIYVDLTNQKLYAKEGDTTVYEFPVSTGKWGKTPTGDFSIWIKLRYTRMSGGSGADYYNLPNVPYVMFFYSNEVPKSMGYSIHGAYWHNNFGHPMSHGCVNMRIEDAGTMYNWANPATEGNTTYATAENPGTPVTIYGTTPQE